MYEFSFTFYSEDEEYMTHFRSSMLRTIENHMYWVDKRPSSPDIDVDYGPLVERLSIREEV